MKYLNNCEYLIYDLPERFKTSDLKHSRTLTTLPSAAIDSDYPGFFKSRRRRAPDGLLQRRISHFTVLEEKVSSEVVPKILVRGPCKSVFVGLIGGWRIVWMALMESINKREIRLIFWLFSLNLLWSFTVAWIYYI